MIIEQKSSIVTQINITEIKITIFVGYLDLKNVII